MLLFLQSNNPLAADSNQSTSSTVASSSKLHKRTSDKKHIKHKKKKHSWLDTGVKALIKSYSREIGFSIDQGDDQSITRVNFPIKRIDVDNFRRMLLAVFRITGQKHMFVNVQCGYILMKRDSKSMRYFYSSWNTSLFPHSRFISNRESIMHLCKQLEKQLPHLIQKLTSKAYSSGYQFHEFTNLRFIVFQS